MDLVIILALNPHKCHLIGAPDIFLAPYRLCVGGLEEVLLLGLLLGRLGRLVFLWGVCALGRPLLGWSFSCHTGLVREPRSGAVLHGELLPGLRPCRETRLSGTLQEVTALGAGFGWGGGGCGADGQLMGRLGLHTRRRGRGHGGLTNRMVDGGWGCGYGGRCAPACGSGWGHSHQHLLVEIFLEKGREEE